MNKIQQAADWAAMGDMVVFIVLVALVAFLLAVVGAIFWVERTRRKEWARYAQERKEADWCNAERDWKRW